MQDNWADLLPLAEYVYNSSPHSVTKVKPFFTYTGWNPILIEIHPYHKPQSLSPNMMEMSQEILAV